MSITIFLADDHAVVRDGLRYLLEAQPDFKVIGDAANGRDAVQQVLREIPDVVLLDIAMPELNGIEAAWQICEARPLINVIILSMYATSEHIYRALQAGVKGYLLKESAGIELVRAIRAVQNGQYYLSQRISDWVIEDFVEYRETRPAASRLTRLNPREREILQLVVESKSSAEIAEMLSLSPKTIETYRSRLMKKLDINDLPSLVKFAIQHGLTSLE